MLVCALDTKGEEAAYIKTLLAEAGLNVRVLDSGVLGEPAFSPDISAEDTAFAGGAKLAELAARRDRGEAVAAMMRGAAAIVAKLYDEGEVAGVIGLGGSAGTSVGTAAMRALPLGIPKVMVTTMASGNTRPFVGQSDITMMNSIVDISGLNRISREMLGNAAYALIGMVQGRREAERRERERAAAGAAGTTLPDKPLIAASMCGVTTLCVDAARAYLEQHGYEVLVFHGTGVGGATMESLIHAGYFAGVIDITTSELADDVAGGLLGAGPERLTMAGRSGVPQVVSVGAADMANFGPPDTVPPHLRANRLLHRHNPSITLMRTNSEENRRLGELIAAKLNGGSYPARTAVYLPLRGVSSMDAPGEPFHGPEEDVALFVAIRAGLRKDIELVEMDCHINDESFALAMARKLVELIEK